MTSTSSPSDTAPLVRRLMAVTSYLSVASMLVVFNKVLFSLYSFKPLVALLTSQLICTVVVCNILQLFGMIELPRVNKESVKRMGTASVVFLFNLIIGFACLKHNPLVIYSSVRRTTCAFTAVAEYVIYKKKQLPQVIMSIVAMVIGALVTVGDAKGDDSHPITVYGLTLVILANCATTMHGLVVRAAKNGGTEAVTESKKSDQEQKEEVKVVDVDDLGADESDGEQPLSKQSQPLGTGPLHARHDCLVSRGSTPRLDEGILGKEKDMSSEETDLSRVVLNIESESRSVGTGDPDDPSKALPMMADKTRQQEDAAPHVPPPPKSNGLTIFAMVYLDALICLPFVLVYDLWNASEIHCSVAGTCIQSDRLPVHAHVAVKADQNSNVV